MEEKANTGQVIIVLTEHLTFGTLLIPYMAEKSDDGTYQLIEQAFHASPEAISRMNEAEQQAIDIASHYTEKYLKWPLLSKIADEMGIFYIATGHYVRKVKVDDTYYITYAVDSDKDQTFFLWGLKQDILRRMLLPMGDITKVEARAFAAERGFQKVAVKRDSLGVCFCPMDYRSFLKKWLVSNCQSQVSVGQPQVSAGQTWSTEVRRGRFVDEKGDFIAWHEGYPFYTVGQRRGLGIHLNRAVFVKEIRPEKNEVVLASLQALEKTEMFLKDWNIVNRERLLGHADIIVKIRYRKQENHCTVTVTPDNFLHVQLHEPLTAIASGQAAAFYKDGLLLGGGIIVEESLLQSL